MSGPFRGTGRDTRAGSGTSETDAAENEQALPRDWATGLAGLRTLNYRTEFLVEEAPAPKRLAPYAFAQTVEVELGETTIATGRLVVLHDPEGQDSWEGATRIIAYVDADVDLEVASDPMLPEVGWSWLQDSLEDSGAEFRALGGTVTQIGSASFGVMSDRLPEGRLQVRASWTAIDAGDLASHARAWALLVSAACGLPPTSEGVASLNTRTWAE